MDLEHLKEIIELVAESGVSEIEIEQDGVRIKVRKEAGILASQMPKSTVTEYVHTVGTRSEAKPASEAETSEPDGTEVRAPIVGTFYASPSPDSDPFVRPGDRVNEGDVLCIIEAMKLMNEIEAEVSGVVREVLVENAHPVEFDQPLFIIDTK